MRVDTARQAGATLLLGLFLASALITVGLGAFPSAMTPLAPVAPAGLTDSYAVLHVPLGLSDLIADAVRQDTPPRPQVAAAGEITTDQGMRERGSPLRQSQPQARRQADNRASSSPDAAATKPTQPREPSQRVDPQPDTDRSGGGGSMDNGATRGRTERAGHGAGKPDRAVAKPNPSVAQRDDKDDKIVAGQLQRGRKDGNRAAGPRAEPQKRGHAHAFATASHRQGKAPKA